MLEELDGGQDLTILLDDQEATANVSKSLRKESMISAVSRRYPRKSGRQQSGKMSKINNENS